MADGWIRGVGSFLIYKCDQRMFHTPAWMGAPKQRAFGYMASRRGRWVIGSYKTALGATLALFTRRTSA